jgi:NAD(P)-dependent dehydrogenase (short-subunit alcohol dehydrogenase family)
MRTIFITGAANGIGLATAKRFAGLGWYVGLYDINRDGVQSLLDSGEFPHACGKHCDVTQRSSIKEALEHFSSHTGGRLDVLVNNAGVLSSGAFEEVEPEAHDLIIDVNVKGLTTVAQEAFPLLKQTAGSTLVNLCSVSSVHGVPLLAVYSASKFYVNGLTEALNIEWAQYDIRVTSVKPPIVNTAMGHAIDQRLTKRMSVDLEPEQIAEAIERAVRGKRVSYLLGTSAKLWAMLDKLLPESGRRRLVKSLSNY